MVRENDLNEPSYMSRKTLLHRMGGLKLQEFWEISSSFSVASL